MKPPPPTTNDPLNKNDEAMVHRAAMLPMILGLLAIGIFAVYTVWDDVLPRRVRKVTTGQMRLQIDSGLPYEELDNGLGYTSRHWVTQMIPDNNVGNFLMIRIGDQVLLSEPANLPAPDHGKRISGFTRTDGHITEQYALWQITGKTEKQIQQNYADTAISLGFSKLQTQTKVSSQNNATNQVYVRSPKLPDAHLTPPAQQVLVIRTQPDTDATVKLLLWYRYPISFDQP